MLFRSIAEQLGVLAEEKNQTIKVRSDDVPRWVGDRVVLRQALLNLVDNAIKYTPAGGAIRVRAMAGASGQPQIEVQDSGPGIAPAHRERIFERFYRANDTSLNGESAGAGLGLAIASWAVAANGGRIELESEESKGSVFRIVLPAS